MALRGLQAPGRKASPRGVFHGVKHHQDFALLSGKSLFLFLEVSAEAPEALFEFFPLLGFIPNSRNRFPYICRFLQVKIFLFPIFFSFLLFFIELRFLFMTDIGKLLQGLRLTASQSPEAECRSGRND